MNIKKILCPMGFSDCDQAANESASDLAEKWQTSIVYLAVPGKGAFDANPEYTMQCIADRELEKLKKFTPTKQEISCSYAVKSSTLTAHTIVEYAKEHDIDLIVMGTHSRTGLIRALMGSVIEAVVRNAGCPVLAIKAEAKALQEN